ncbi:hypothetical protein F7R21_22360 [Burkholderia latens]|uniref:Uncharacterized protein n=2 Tax=Burkholderia latens TaxID=488446 RepID=A0A6H9THX5_9BURK|nr:hypothetical protein [Burkholderia latens]KAB0636717.1 hypothetical protein F7R21_22360 [Burkholderia latens]
MTRGAGRHAAGCPTLPPRIVRPYQRFAESICRRAYRIGCPPRNATLHKNIVSKTNFGAASNDFIDRYGHDRTLRSPGVCDRYQCVRHSEQAGRDRGACGGQASTRIAIRSRSELQRTERVFADHAEVNSIVILADVPIKNRGYS